MRQFRNLNFNTSNRPEQSAGWGWWRNNHDILAGRDNTVTLAQCHSLTLLNWEHVPAGRNYIV